MKSGELLGCLAVSAFLAAGQGWADEAVPSAIGRIGAVVGSVQYRSPMGEWAEALVNEPVAADSGLRTASYAESALRIAGAEVSLAPSSEFRVLRADRDALQIAVIRGRIGVHLAANAVAHTVEIDLPRGGVWLGEPGDYDIAAGDAREPARVEVFAGKAEFGGGLDEKNLATATGDTFSDWWRSQNDNAATADIPNMPPEIAGAAALDAAGRWDADSKYGVVWYPSDVAEDWTPYRDGLWRFLPPWGWTWIDHAAWGFAPSHYGRWTRIDDRWAWVPGGEELDYSPATVAFLGTAGIGLSRPGEKNGSAVAWFPLAPGETVGDGNEGSYQNRRFATAVPRAVFAAGGPVAAALVDLPVERFADAPVIMQALGISPANGVLVAAAPRKSTVVATDTTGDAPLASGSEARRPYVVQLRDLPARAAVPVRETRRKITVAAATPPRIRVLPSTSALHSPHNRQRFAAARGGA
jgi:hypothetical protein